MFNGHRIAGELENRLTHTHEKHTQTMVTISYEALKKRPYQHGHQLLMSEGPSACVCVFICVCVCPGVVGLQL